VGENIAIRNIKNILNPYPINADIKTGGMPPPNTFARKNRGERP